MRSPRSPSLSEEGSLSTRGPGALLPETDSQALRAYTLQIRGPRPGEEPQPAPLAVEHLDQRARWIPREALKPSRDPCIWIG